MSAAYDRLATAIFNEIYGDPSIEPARSLRDIEAEGIPELVQEWETIRATLAKMPDTVLTALLRLRARASDERAVARWTPKGRVRSMEAD